MSSFLSDCKVAVKMLRGTVRDEDDNVLTLWGKLGVAWDLICGIIVVGPDEVRRDTE